MALLCCSATACLMCQRVIITCQVGTWLCSAALRLVSGGPEVFIICHVGTLLCFAALQLVGDGY